MAKQPYLTAPIKTTGMPPGIPYIIGNEAAERFCYYGLRGILVVFMTRYLMDASGNKATMSQEDAKAWYHTFVSAVYFFPIIGAIVSDGLVGKYRMIIALSLVYCVGTVALAMDSTRLGLVAGLGLIALGSGGIKPCVSAHVGDQFGQSNQHLLARAFGWFYFSVNFGSSFSVMMTPWLLDKYGPKVAFGVPSILMFLATVVFWIGRRKFIHIPPAGMGFVRDTFGKTGLKAVMKLAVIYCFVAMFWALWEQSASAWVLQAEKMDLNLFGFKVLASQVQTANPILILIYIPIFSYLIYPAVDKVFPLTPLRKMGIGFVLTFISFLVPAWIETQIAAGARPSIGWQILAFAILTAGEVCVSITCLEFSYTQAPKTMKSFVMALFLLSVSMGNAFTAAVNFFIKNADGTSKLPGAQYYLFFAGLMLATAIGFIFVARKYKEEYYIQDEAPATKPEGTCVYSD